MNEYKQQLSACLDGELDVDEIRRFQPELEAGQFSTASRYQLMAAAMRGELEGDELIDISQQLRVAILQETSYSLEQTSAAKTAEPRTRLSWWHPVGGMALAASVALIMIVAVTDVESPGTDAQLASQGAAQQKALKTAPATQSLIAQNPGQEKAYPAANLNTYLSEHSEFAAQDTMQGRMPYVRAVSYESK